MVVVKPKLPVVASSVTWLYNLTPEGNPFSSRSWGYLSPLELVLTESLCPVDTERCIDSQESTQSPSEELSRKAQVNAGGVRRSLGL